MPIPKMPKPNKAARVGGLETVGTRAKVAPHGAYDRASETPAGNVNTKSTQNTANYSVPNQKRMSK